MQFNAFTPHKSVHFTSSSLHGSQPAPTNSSGKTDDDGDLTKDRCNFPDGLAEW
jgi:hypothetical protein